MTVETGAIQTRTRGDGDTIDLTPELAELVRESDIANGIATVFIGGSTAGITTIEYESGVIEYLDEVLETVAPRGRDWRHHRRWGDHNGYSHIRSALIGPSLTVPFVDGELALGTWQQVVLIDFDERGRNRTVLVQMLGE